jgi:hypothetical protein
MSTEHVSRRLRGLIGVDEGVLRWVPQEGPRYTKLGAIICLTATFSALSMLVMTVRLFPGPYALLGAVGVAVFWGTFIVVLDSWLITSLHGATRRKAGVYLPRLVIAALLGLVIAEPVVVLVFRPAIDQQIADNREAERASLSSVWRRCNPPTDAPVAGTACADHRLNLPGSPSTLRAQFVELRERRDTEAAELGRDMNHWKHLDAVARAECAGVAGPETTGVPGEGPECTHNRSTADQFRRDSRLEQRQAGLTALDGELRTKQDQLTTSEATYGEQVRVAIERKVAAWEESRRTVGILEELDALGQLSEKSTPVTVAHWVFRALLVLLDCTPVLAKWMSGTTAYDRRLSGELTDGEAAHDAELARRAKERERAGEDRTAERSKDEEIERLYEMYRREVR